MWENRTMCDVLEEMRKCAKTANYGNLPGLIEEAQSMANRMEAGLACKRDLKAWDADWRKYGKRLKVLKAKVKELEGDAPEKP